ncbi:hypothetical protein B0T14DRAFT_499110 [Immersiella caudata]|uniref:Protein kinase domain-containing protein n=1 Tax=Immersiella caudata TaxID=314043 RepID=A0AA40BU27_9PEZI|nr:hypothetical protein B0T14DRAFT_499110 [Immersiella caudata]
MARQVLADQILGATVESQFDKGGDEFVPEGRLNAIIVTKAIEEELETSVNEPEFWEVVGFIHDQAPRLFAIAVCAVITGAELYQAMKLFMRNEFCDDNLPIKQWDPQEVHEFSTMSPKLWPRARIRAFYTNQWLLLAPVFRVATESPGENEHDFQYYFERSHPLPFTERFTEGSDSGSFGQVFKYKVHPDHLIDPENPDREGERYVAVKGIIVANEVDPAKIASDWGREASNLQKMNSLRQPNIVRFITAFQVRRVEKNQADHYLMFEWADGGNLRNLWRTLPLDHLTPMMVKDAVKQILGLATALSEAHYALDPLVFRHGDLKPENILWFKPMEGDTNTIGTLKIADWGLAKQHILETQLRGVGTSNPSGTKRYAPPEEVEEGLWAATLRPPGADKPTKKRSRLYDVWAMGCITLEFIVWLRYGPDGLWAFNRQILGPGGVEYPAPFYTTKVTQNGKKIAEVHETVIRWMDHMSKDPAFAPGETALGDILELVRERLLVVELPTTLGTSYGPSSFAASGSQPSSRGGSRSREITPLQTPDLTAVNNIDPEVPDIPDANTADIPILISSPDDNETPAPPMPPTTPKALPERGRAPVPGRRESLTQPKTPPIPTAVSEYGQVPSRGKGRALSCHFKDLMEHIVTDNDTDEYWLSWEPNLGLGPEYPETTGEVGGDANVNSDRTPRQHVNANPVTEKNDAASQPTVGGLHVPAKAGVPQTVVHEAHEVHPNLGPSHEYVSGQPDQHNTVRSAHKSPKPGSERKTVLTTIRVAVKDEWESLVDNKFASSLFATMKSSKIALPESQLSSNLCEECKDLRKRIWIMGFNKTYHTDQLRQRAETKICDLCGLLWKACERHRFTEQARVLFERHESSLKINGVGQRALSIFRSPELELRIGNTIQIGFPKLSKVASKTHFQVIKQWITNCNENHGAFGCLPTPDHPSSPASAAKQLPTRVIEVGHPGDSRLYLRETASGGVAQGEWLALSHQWGPGPHFSTTRKTLFAHLEGIDFDALPATFRDAVTVTRALGYPYLWIDSLCIIQGDDGDFHQEAKRMEQVYSGACCVLAISRTAGHTAGFLTPRKDTDYVTLQNGRQAPFYVCEAIDDFDSHVLKSDLSKRGWVLQEHALARRTVFYTDHQTYWECGEGIRSHSELAALLGDPNFPHRMLNASRGGKITLFQDLYKRYSSLGLRNEFDRPTAIDGLQHRILTALGLKGGFGALDGGTENKGLLRRSLLWVGAENQELNRIKFAVDRKISVVPSWSWMAYTGTIDYISPPFNGVDWEELQSPWSGYGKGDEGIRTEVQGGNIALVAEAREYDPGKGSTDDSLLAFDKPNGLSSPKTLCVILGRQKGVASDHQRHYLLFIEAAGRDRNGKELYERVGVGYLPGRCVEGGSFGRVTIH